MQEDTRRKLGRRRRLRGLGPTPARAAIVAAVVLVALPFGSAAASTSSKHAQFGFGAIAYGTQAVVGNILESGPSAVSSLGGSCETKVGVKNRNRTASVKVHGLVATGTVHSHAASKKTKSGLASVASAETQGISLLNGLIKAHAVTATSKSTHNSKTGKFGVSAGGTKLVGLVVDHKHIKITPKPNTKIKLPGIGYVMLNQQGASVNNRSAALTVIGIHVVVNLGSKKFPAGTQLYVSVATSALAGPAKAMLAGGANGIDADVANTVLIGASFPAGLGCLGTQGKRVSNSGAGLQIKGIVSSGTVRDRARGNATKTRVYGKTSSTIEGANVLSGLVKATVIKGAVSANGKNPTKLSDKSKFVGLKVSGHPLLKGNVKPNTHFSVAGIGTVWLHRQVKTAKGITVVMVQIVIGVPHNKLHLPLGAIVDIGYASAQVL